MAGPNFTTHNVINPYDAFSKSMANTSNFFVNAANSLANDERLKQQQAMDQARLAIANRSLALNERTTEADLQRKAKEQADKEVAKRTLTDYTKTADKHIPALVLANDTALRDKLNSTAVNKFNQFTKAHAKEYGLNPDEKYNPEWDDDKKAAWSTGMDKLRQAFYAKASKATDKAYKDAVPVDKTKAKAAVFRDLVTKGLDPTKADTMAAALTNGYTDFAALEANRTSANNKKVEQLTNLLKALPKPSIKKSGESNSSANKSAFGVPIKNMLNNVALDPNESPWNDDSNRGVVSNAVAYFKRKGFSDKQISLALQSSISGAIDDDVIDEDKLISLTSQTIQKIPNTRNSNDPYAGDRKALVQKIAALTSDTPSIQGTAKYKLVNTFDKALSKDLGLGNKRKVHKNKPTASNTKAKPQVSNPIHASNAVPDKRSTFNTSPIVQSTLSDLKGASTNNSPTAIVPFKPVTSNHNNVDDTLNNPVYKNTLGEKLDTFLHNSGQRVNRVKEDVVGSISNPNEVPFRDTMQSIKNQPNTYGGYLNGALDAIGNIPSDATHIAKHNLGYMVLANEFRKGLMRFLANPTKLENDHMDKPYNGYTPKQLEAARSAFMSGKRIPPDLYDALIKYSKTKGSNSTPTNWAIGK